MGIKERKARERRRRKDQILTAAIELMEEQGFENTTMDEIAERAELSKGTLYLYFKDKSTLHQAIKKQALNHLHENFLLVIQKDLPGAELLKRMVLSFLKIITQNAAFVKAMAIYEHITKNEESTEEHTITEECKHIEDELFMLLVRSVQIGIQDGSIKTSMPPKIVALTISFQMTGMLHFNLSGARQDIQEILQDNDLTIPALMGKFLDVQLNESTKN